MKKMTAIIGIVLMSSTVFAVGSESTFSCYNEKGTVALYFSFDGKIDSYSRANVFVRDGGVDNFAQSFGEGAAKKAVIVETKYGKAKVIPNFKKGTCSIVEE